MVINIYPDGRVSNHFDEFCETIATAIPIPPHGRLIDADYADDYAYDELAIANSYLTGWEAARAMQKIYQNAPTIIEAEVEE